MDTIEYFKAVVVVMLFYSFAITAISYAMPDDALNYVTGFSSLAEEVDFQSVTEQVQESVDRQLNIPLIELGAVVFYSGNVLVDLALNFVFAIPQMIGMLVNGIMLLFNVDSGVFALVQAFASAVLVISYMIGLMQLLTNVRTGRAV